MSLSTILNSHHAILVEGEASYALRIIHAGFRESGLTIEGNPDIIFLTFQKFGIEDARNIIDMSQGAPVRDEKKIIVFSFESITNDAQNAFLKIFEDPTPTLRFVLHTDSVNSLLATLKSRLHIIKSGMEDDFDREFAMSFLGMNIKDRMIEVEKIIKAYKDSGSKKEMKKFLLGLHVLVKERVERNKDTKNINALKVIADALDYIEDKSASMKILLESVAISL